MLRLPACTITHHLDAWSSPAILRADWEAIRTIITSNSEPGCSVLDVGCYTGKLLHSLGEAYLRAGVEPNQAAAELASKVCQGPVWNSLESIPSDRRFDVVVSIDVIEHNESPRAFVEKLLKVAYPGELVIISTGNVGSLIPRPVGSNWWYCYFPEHISFISMPWLRHYSKLLAGEIPLVVPFIYQEKHGVVWLSDAVQTVVYGLIGADYLQLVNTINLYRDQKYQAYPKGMGVSKDHFIVALKALGGVPKQ